MTGFGGFKGDISLPAASEVNSAAKGVYTLEDAAALRKLGRWPLLQRVVTITAQPSGQYLVSGGATFSVTASVNEGGTLTYQWYRQAQGTGDFSAISGETLSSLVLTGLTQGANENDVYRVVVSATSAQSVTSSNATLTMPPATAPDAPTGVSGVAGDAQVALTWSAPAFNGGASITDYIVQYSANSGSTWSTFSDSTSASTAAVVTGLVNDTAYIFRVAAVNNVGTGSYSAASSSVTPAEPSASPTVEYLLVAGGGGGGTQQDGGGGGGAGGLLTGTFTMSEQDVLNVTVGAGGINGVNGQNSVFSSFTAIGGGYGGNNDAPNGSNGGSGGGVGRDGCGTPGTGTAGQGNSGGTTDCGGWQSAGGGGGAGEAGYNGGYDIGGISGTTSKGGDGVASSITGTATYYAGGGGGGSNGGVAPGGLGGGGNGNGGSGVTGDNGTANTGGGGGGGRSGTGGTGGSGVVVVAYPNTYPDLAVSSTLTYTQPTREGYKVYKFTAGTGAIALQNLTAAPSAPSSVTGVAGNQQVALSWPAAFSAGPSITDYVIEYSSDAGSTWTVFSDGTGTSTTATITGLTNDTAYLFRVAAVNSIGTGAYATSSAVTPNLFAITTQPKNDYATSSSQNITFSVGVVGGGTPTYQWQYFGPNYDISEYDYIWRNISGATSSSYTTNGNTMSASNLMSYDFYYTGSARLRCIVTAAGGTPALTSDTVRFLQLDFFHYPYIYWETSQGNYPSYGQPQTISLASGESLLLNLSDYAMSSPDVSWYTGNDKTIKVQVATNGYTDSADWTDLYTVDQRQYLYLPGHVITPSTGTKYYRAIVVHKWPYTVNNGTQSVTYETAYIWPRSTYDVVQVTWPAVAPFDAPNSAWTSVGFSGTGTASDKYYKASISAGTADGMAINATAAGTVRITADNVSADNEYIIYVNNVAVLTLGDYNGANEALSATLTVAAGATVRLGTAGADLYISYTNLNIWWTA